MEYIKGINLFNGLSSLPNKKKESKSSTPFKTQKKFEEKNIIYLLINPSRIPKEFL
jgi:hypothetical protein